MTFNSFSFYLFFLFVAVVYYLLPKHWRWVWLLITSYVFYGLTDIRFVVILLACTVISYMAGRMIDRQDNETKRKRWMAAGVGLIAGILILFKYLNFLMGSLNAIIAAAGLQWHWRGVDLLFPVGISFYSLQVMSYLLDVHSGKISAERNFPKYALYVSFFPQLLIGPIERFGKLKPQLTDPARFKWRHFVDSLVRIGWGLFKKFVIADRLAVIANSVFAAPADFASPKLVLGVLAFSFQIYLDFSAYTDIAIGTASVLGIKLMENFEQPYFARSVIDFWRRWHISLSNWLRDYIFLKLNYKHRRRKPRQLWTGLDVIATFLVSGLWHGANWTFVVWGLLHGLYQTVELLTQKGRKKLATRLKIPQDWWGIKTWQTLATFLLVSMTWIFFKAESITQASEIIGAIFSLDRITATNAWTFMDGSLGLDAKDLWMTGLMLLTTIAIEFFQQRNDLLAWLNQKPIWLRWCFYYALFFAITIFGYYGEATVVDFVYFQF